eukprot:364865-Chlamydomonas_euryale.AAC.5
MHGASCMMRHAIAGGTSVLNMHEGIWGTYHLGLACSLKTVRTQILGKHWTRGARRDLARAAATALRVCHGAKAGDTEHA